MNKKQPETTERTKQIIKDAFWELYKQKRIAKITVKDITTKAGYNRATFYSYFSDVYDVLEQIENDVMPGAEHLPPTRMDDHLPLDFVQGIMSIYEKNSEYYSLLLSEKGDPNFVVKLKNIFKRLVRDSLKDSLMSNTKLDNMDIDYALEFFTGATISIIKHWYDSDKNIPIEQLMVLMQQLMNNQFVQKLQSIETS